MKFVAEDGKVFDTMVECEVYEKKLGIGEMGQAAAILNDYVVMLNYLGKVVEPETDYKENCEKFLTEFEKIMVSQHYEGAKYVVICPSYVDSNEKIINALKWFSDYAGIYIPCKPGVWRWDEEEEWIEYTDDYLNFRHNWEKVESYIK